MSINQIGSRLAGRGGSIAAALLLTLMLAVVSGCGGAGGDRSDTAASATASDEAAIASSASEPELQRNLYETAGIADPEAFDRMFAAVQAAVAADDKAAAAALALYPVRVNFSKTKFIQIKNEEQFIAKYDQIITPSVKEALRNQKSGELFANAKGVMAGAGQMWFGATASTPQQYGIIAINP